MILVPPPVQAPKAPFVLIERRHTQNTICFMGRYGKPGGCVKVWTLTRGA